MFYVKSLQGAALNSLVDHLKKWERRPKIYTNEELVKVVIKFRRYSALAKPLLHLVAERCCFLRYNKLSALFLSCIIEKRKTLKLRGDSYRELIVDLIVEHRLLDSETLKRVTELYIEENFSHKLDLLFSKFPNVEIFRIENGLNDNTLKSIVRHFPRLKVLDDSNDETCSITEDGLKQLVQLVNLNYVLFHTAQNLWHPRSEILGSVVASLMQQLQGLVKITCPCDIMETALRRLNYYKCVLLNVRSLNLGNIILSSDILLDIQDTCPNLERLEVNVRENEDLHVVEILPNLAELHIEFSQDFKFSFNIGVIGSQLRVLDFESINFSREIILRISENCPNVEYLAVGGICPESSPTLQNCLEPSWPLLFPRLDTLNFHCGDLECLFFFMHRNSSLRHIICNCDFNPFALRGLEPEHGIWPRVTAVTLTFLRESFDEFHSQTIAKHLVEAIPSLERIYLSNVRNEDGFVWTSSRGNRVRICSNDHIGVTLQHPEFDTLDYL